MTNDLEQFYFNIPEPSRSCMLAIKDYILGFDSDIQPAWKFKGPFFMYKEKNLCYMWLDKKTKHPYIGMIRGNLLDHPSLVQGERKVIKILPIDPNDDLPVDIISEILAELLPHY